jgi:hypothetical protein
MNREYQKMWEAQREMLDQWLAFSRKMFQPVKEEKKSRATGKKDKKASTDSPTDWPKSMMEFYRHWTEAQGEAAKKWMSAFGEMSGVPDPYFSNLDLSKTEENGAKFWKSWMGQMGQLWPYTKSAGRPAQNLPLLNAYADWLSGLYQAWKPQVERLEAMGYHPDFINKYFSGEAFREALKKAPGVFPPETWTDFLNKTHQGFDKYIEFLNDVDLPFDEMAAYWDRMLVRFTPLDEVPMFRLGNSIHHYLEILANPFYAIAGTPKLMRIQKAWRDIQFYYLSFMLKNAELRGKILESSLAVVPETIRSFVDAKETSEEAPSGMEFYEYYVDNLDQHLQKLLASDEYGSLQNEVARVGVELKSKLDELVELSLEGLPLMTKSDEDDIAKEIESLRVKMRELSNRQKKDLGKKALKEEAMN